MNIEEYKSLYPRNEVFIQNGDTERIMTIEEYEEWVEQAVYNANNPII